MIEATPRTKTIVLIAAVAKNGVIGNADAIPWHVPEDFAHFRRSTSGQTLLMGRTTFDSIGKPLPNRTTIVLTRDRTWSRPGVRVAHDLQSAIDLAEDLPGDLIVAGGSHVYAEAHALAQIQIISEIDAEPEGDAFFPEWDHREWNLSDERHHHGFSIKEWHRLAALTPDRAYEMELVPGSEQLWWSKDWTRLLSEAVSKQRRQTRDDASVNWTAVHQAAARVLIRAAEDHNRRGERADGPSGARRVLLSSRLSLQDVKATQGALFHWSDYLTPRNLAMR